MFWIGIIVILIIINYLYNETTLFYKKEPTAYEKPNPEDFFDPAVAPQYHLQQNKKAIMFIHGYSNNAHEFRAYADQAKEEGFDVIVPLQPGAGTNKDDFKKTYFSQWYAAMRDQYQEYRPQYDEFFIVGVSMGGAMTLKLTEEFAQTKLAPTAVVTLCAPVFLNSVLENHVLYNFGLYFSHIGGLLVSEIAEKKPRIEIDDANLKKSYYGTYPRQAHSLKMGLRPIKKNLAKIDVPILLLHAKGDKTVPYANMAYITKKIKSKEIRTISYDLSEYPHSHHNINLFASTRDNVYQELISFIKTRATK